MTVSIIIIIFYTLSNNNTFGTLVFIIMSATLFVVHTRLTHRRLGMRYAMLIEVKVGFSNDTWHRAGAMENKILISWYSGKQGNLLALVLLGK